MPAPNAPSAPTCPQTYVIGLGSNLGDRASYLARGAEAVLALSGVRVLGLSSVYETKAVGVGPAQPDYLNAAVSLTVESALVGEALLDALLAIERAEGRVRDVRHGPRTLDLDVLWSSRPESSSRLRVPHPSLCERTFALAPLIEVAPELSAIYAPVLARLGGAPERVGALRLHGVGAQDTTRHPHVMFVARE